MIERGRYGLCGALKWNNRENVYVVKNRFMEQQLRLDKKNSSKVKLHEILSIQWRSLSIG